MAVHRIIDQQEEHRFTSMVEKVNLVHAQDLSMPFGNFFTAYDQLHFTKVEIDRSAQQRLDLLFRCPVAASASTTPVGGTEYTLMFFADRINDEIVVSPITTISITTTVLTGTSQTVDVLSMMADYVNAKLYWSTDTNTGAQSGRIWQGTYDGAGVISGVTTILNNLTQGVRGIWVDWANDLVYYTTNDNKFKKVVISSGSVTEIASPLSNPKDLWLANSTLMYITLTGIGNIVKYNLGTDVASNVFGASNDHGFIDGHFARDFTVYRRDGNTIIRKNDLTFLAEQATWINTGGVQDFHVDRVAEKLYYIDQSGTQVKQVNYDKSGETAIGTLNSPANYRHWTIG